MNQITFTFHLIYIIQVVKYTYIINIVHSLVHPSIVPKVDTTNSENHISDQDPNILNLMVSHYDCAKQNNLRQFSLLNVEPCKQAPSNIQHTKTQATIYVRAKAKRIKAFKCEAYIKTEKVWCSQTFTSSRRYDRLRNTIVIRNTERNTHKGSLKERKSLKLRTKINEIYFTNENKRKKS